MKLRRMVLLGMLMAFLMSAVGCSFIASTGRVMGRTGDAIADEAEKGKAEQAQKNK